MIAHAGPRFLCGQKLPAVMPRHRQIEKCTGLNRRRKPHRDELFGAAYAAALG
jgi:hypothetical protein